ncbi:MAG: hypothetical protein A2Z20_02935 [Bdellovibrionales bacterium RBG_16_40_8]|nr:MAG: hypothetical protein A2Z20_02935 [Bdellovibrionales bacterium RBG_16_40_8]
MSSLGYPPRDILNLFLIQGVILGFSGAVLGLFVGFFLCVYMGSLDFDMMGQKGLLVSYNPSIYIGAFLMAFISSIMASILPARTASRMTPIDIIRMEG